MGVGFTFPPQCRITGVVFFPLRTGRYVSAVVSLVIVCQNVPQLVVPSASSAEQKTTPPKSVIRGMKVLEDSYTLYYRVVDLCICTGI